MTEQPFGERNRFRKWIAGISAVLIAAQAVAAPESRLQDAPQAVAKITAEQLNALPVNRDLRAILDLHNGLRKEVGARPLRWNTALAGNAQRYADTLAQTGQVEHSSRVGRENERENIIVGARSGISPLQMVQTWTKERQLFRPGKFPDICSGDWSLCGHYSQMIWLKTTDVGCGYAYGRFVALVCRYSPPGNKDGVAVGPGALTQERELAERLCTTPRGMVIACKNEDDEDGGVIDDGGGGDQDSGVKEEEVCAVDVNVHNPISVDPDQLIIPDAEELVPGATTLRNDDSDWRLGRESGTGNLPVISIATDETRGGNANENDLVKVMAHNPAGLTDVYLFAFPTHAEADRALGTQVRSVNDGRHAKGGELGYFTAADKPAPPAPGLPRAILAGATTLWVEAKLGGRYRLVIGKLIAGVQAADVRYNGAKSIAYQKDDKDRASVFECEDQATVTAAVVDIYQVKSNDNVKRLTAFDVYWGGRPHFRAKVWPGGKKFSWGEPYRLGAAVHQMPGAAVDGEVARMIHDGEDVKGDGGADLDGTTVAAKGEADGGIGAKGSIEGGFQIEAPQAGNVPTVNRDVANRYPNRVSLEYEVNDVKLVRPEYLEVILPMVRPPAASLKMGDDFGVESGVPYTIVDVFNRPIKIGKIVGVTEYLHLYGAGLKAWEALEGQPGRVVESGPTKDGQGQPVADTFNDYLYLTNTGVDDRGNPLGPIGPLGTAQRSQTLVRSDRMTEGIFKDTLNFSTREQINQRQALWIAASGRQGATPAETRQNLQQAADEAKARDDALNRRNDPRDQRLSAADKRAAIQGRLRDVPAADQRRITSSPVLAVPQDVILQLRVDTTRHDLMMFQGNRLSVFAPYFFKDNKYIGDKSHPIFQYHIQFTPGAATSQLVQPPHRRPR